jgi:hypothetical protein
MKTRLLFAVLPAFALALVTSSAAVFTNDAVIGPLNTNYDGLDIVASNCVLTVDGAHTFASVRVAGTGMLTHSSNPDGVITLWVSVTNEAEMLNGTNAVSLANSNVLLASVIVQDSSGTVTYTNNADYTLNSLPDGSATIQRTDASTIPDGATVMVSYQYSAGTTAAGLNLIVSGNVEIEPAATINANGLGYANPSSGLGPGGQAGYPLTGSGGGYGGYGGISSANAAGGNPYGSLEQALALGSPGGQGVGGVGGPGGGSIRLVVDSDFRLNGTVTANGLNATNSRSGGGSGGGVWVTTQTFEGTGAITANGGAGEPIHGGGGGGGRIAVEFATNNFTGTATAFGGTGWQRGGAGTIFLRPLGTPGAVTFDNAGFAGGWTLFQLSSPSDVTVQGSAIAVLTSLQTAGSLLVRSNSSIVLGAFGFGSLNLTVQKDAVVEKGASIPLDGRGFVHDSGTGVGQLNSGAVLGGGAGHGGYGGGAVGPTGTSAPGGTTYDSTANPTAAGSGGRSVFSFLGGDGGGAARITVTGKLLLNGRISADGTAAPGSGAGGGSGGSVWLTLGGLSGAGTISADGGSGGQPYGGGGGGGRISILYTSNSFAGTIAARGGAGAVAGGAGTIYLKPNSGVGNLIVDNGGIRGTNTTCDPLSLNNMVINGGAYLTSSITSLTLSNLTIGSQSAFLAGQGFTLTATNIIVESGGAFSADGVSATENGAQFSPSGSGGAGHGGAGGRGLAVAGGIGFDNSVTPTQPGSRGGSSQAPFPNGGGALRIVASGNLQVDGAISANGMSIPTNNNGGGAGGSIWISTGSLSGAGRLSADGGSGHLPFGGGGAGGRISINYASNLFTGTVSAKGGAGYNNGGAGTIYLKPNGNAGPTLVIDNGGLSGTNTVLDQTSLAELRILGAAYANATATSFTIGRLIIGTNSTFQLSSNSSSFFTITSNAIVDGLLSAEGNTVSGSGQGFGSASGSSGAGHGGYGGHGLGIGGGFAYDSVTSPSQPGSRGGSIVQTGGPGGGAIRMTVTGLLSLNGRISANGLPGVAFSSATNNGGGSGGSLWLTLGGLSGSGTMSADGGSGNLPYGGGGGGGRISITYFSNSFIGTFSARGGPGYEYGGAGTIYLKPIERPLGDIIVDNGGIRGTNTSGDGLPGALGNLSITGGASIASSVFSLTVSNLTIGSNSALQFGQNVNLTVSGTGSVAASGRISSDANSVGPGSGVPSSSGSGGGAHGGYGGSGFGAPGGSATDTAATPYFPGGPGGSASGPQPPGGGAIRMNVTKLLQLDGTISANGQNATSNNSAGGAGGSVWLTVGGLAGSGMISANGGSGHLPAGGGGGGGRIAVYYGSNTFSGQWIARGGAGFVNGGAGTVYSKANTNQTAQVFVDNGGPKGTNTAVFASGSFDLTVQGGGVGDSIISPRDLLVRSNGWIGQVGNLNVTRNAIIDAGGGINLDGLGNDQFGTGLTSRTQAGGGGHGGYGGRRSGSFGAAYENASAPTRGGSAGGNGSGTSLAPVGGRGGGGLFFSVGNNLTVNGMISAGGLDGQSNSGGGSGGSLQLHTTTLSGLGAISARGGNGDGSGGGGGGGRIAIYYDNNSFTGPISACGGTGFETGGAGTIYLRANGQAGDQLLVDNCGAAGAPTPLSHVFGVGQNLTVGNGGEIEFQGAIPVLSNLTVNGGGTVTGIAADTNLELAVIGNVLVATGASLSLDAKGFTQATGPGAGNTLSNKGSGAGYGGAGGASSSGASGGAAYGSSLQPIDRGSGGGLGLGTGIGGSEGGGALRLSVGGRLTVNGSLSSDGGDALQDDSGGGSGGSVWIVAQTLDGNGIIFANGGAGELYGGGGGAGGRIAVYSPGNSFTGQILVQGGTGSASGGAGTVYSSSTMPGLQVLSQSPQGVVSNTVGQIMVGFNSAVSPASVDVNDVVLATPDGVLPSVNITLSQPNPSSLLIAFPNQNVPGNYRLELGPGITDLLGQPMSQVYTGAFTIAIPVIAGRITDTNGQGVAGVFLQQNPGTLSAVSDANGIYSLGVDPGWTGNVIPSLNNMVFAPWSRAYTNVMLSFSNQDYVAVDSLAATVNARLQGSNLAMSWFGISGVTYQPQYSTNLVDWLPYGGALPGTNGPAEFLVPVSSDPSEFFRLKASN